MPAAETTPLWPEPSVVFAQQRVGVGRGQAGDRGQTGERCKGQQEGS